MLSATISCLASAPQHRARVTSGFCRSQDNRSDVHTKGLEVSCRPEAQPEDSAYALPSRGDGCLHCLDCSRSELCLLFILPCPEQPFDRIHRSSASDHRHPPPTATTAMSVSQPVKRELSRNIDEETAPPHDLLITWASSIQPDRLLPLDEWLRAGSPTPRYSGPKPSYQLKLN